MKNILLIVAIATFMTAGCKSRKIAASRVWTYDKPQSDDAKADPGSVADTNLRFIGRWDFSDKNSATSYWGGAYIKTQFSGASVKMIVGHSSNFFVKIDDMAWTTYLNRKDTIDIGSVHLNKGWHTLTVAQGKDYDYIFDFKGFLFDQGARTRTGKISSVLIEYVGDSITTGYTDSQANVSDYAWLTSETLGTEHTQIAYPGINLASGYGRIKGTGMDQQYQKSRSLKYPDAPEWNFQKYRPDIVVINLGTNDNNNKVPDSVFTRSYVSLMKFIRSKFPETKILAMRTFLGIKVQPTINAVKQMTKEGDKNIFYLDTSGWLTPKTGDYNDTAHPSDSGQIKAGRLLVETLKHYLR